MLPGKIRYCILDILENIRELFRDTRFAKSLVPVGIGLTNKLSR